MLSRTITCWCVLCSTISGAATATADRYAITDLGTLAGGTSSYALAVNSSGMVAGYATVDTSGTYRAAVYSGGSWTDIGTPFNSSNRSFATGINDSGQVVGWERVGGQIGDTFLWHSGAGYTDLGAQPGVLNGQPGNGLKNRVGGLEGDSITSSIGGGGINNSGQVAGFWLDSSSDQHVFLYSGGTTTEVSTGGATGVNWASAINDSGVVVGRYQPAGGGLTDGFWWDGTMHFMPITGTADPASPTCIAGNYVVGSTSSSPLTGGHGFLYTLNSAGPTDLGSLGSNVWSIALGVDSAGTAVGSSGPAFNNATDRAFVAGSGTMADLNTLLLGADPFSSLQIATAISDNGKYIAGYGLVGGATHGFLLTATLPGDANLDGKVDVNDLTIVLTDFGRSGMIWSQGDFNGDGKVDVNDLTILLSNFSQSLGSPAGGMSSVPEPGALAVLATGLLGLLAVGSGRWAVGGEQRAAGSGQRAVGSGQWAVGSGQSAVGGREICVTVRESPVPFAAPIPVECTNDR